MTWHGEKEVATIVSSTGFKPGMDLRNLFDFDDMTDWHSGSGQSTKRLEITFINRINFVEIAILRTQSKWDDRYKDVCLVIDNDENNDLCTDSMLGFSDVKSEYITWKKPIDDVKTITLEFRTPYYARIAEMKIIYKKQSELIPIYGEP